MDLILNQVTHVNTKSTCTILEVLQLFTYDTVHLSHMGMTARHTASGDWEFPPVDESMETSCIWEIKEYIH